MRVLLQRVTEATVRIDGEIVGQCGRGFLLLIGVKCGDTERDLEYLVGKCLGLRVFEDSEGKMNLGLTDIGGEILAVSQFTLYADTRHGRRPGFTQAAPPSESEPLYEKFVARLRESGLKVETGRFGADMKITLVNDGPVTIMLDSAEAIVAK